MYIFMYLVMHVELYLLLLKVFSLLKQEIAAKETALHKVHVGWVGKSCQHILGVQVLYVHVVNFKLLMVRPFAKVA